MVKAGFTAALYDWLYKVASENYYSDFSKKFML